jgi:hypothetical protein
MTDTVLDLSKLVSETEERGEPPLIDPEGTPHYFRDRDSMSLRERAQVDGWVKRHDKLAEKETPTEADERAHEQLQLDICAYVLPTASRDVFVDLNTGQRTALIVAFLVDSGMESTVGKVAMSRGQKIGALSSRDSNGSTTSPTR